MSRYYSKAIFDAVKRALNGYLRYNENTETGWVLIETKPPKFNGGKVLYVISVYDDSYNVYSFLDSITVDANDVSLVTSMCEYICRVNEGRKNGGFDFNIEKGKVSYRTFTYCPNENFDANLFYEDLGIHEHMYERFGNEMMAVYYRMKTAKEAYECSIKNG